MLNLLQLVIEPFVQELKNGYRQIYGDLAPEYGNIVAWNSYVHTHRHGLSPLNTYAYPNGHAHRYPL